MIGTAANVNDVTQGYALLHGETYVFAGAGHHQGQHPGQGGASVSGDQAPVRFYEGALPGLGQEHGAAGHTVCAEQFVDGQEANSSGAAGMSAPAVRANARQQPEKGELEGQTVQKSDVDAAGNSSCEFVGVNSRCGNAYADHP